MTGLTDTESGKMIHFSFPYMTNVFAALNKVMPIQINF